MSDVELKDGISPYLAKLFDISAGLGMQSLSKSASKVQIAMKNDSKNAGFSDYHMRIKNGHRVITKGKKRLYDRYSHTTGQKLAPMGDLIRFKQYPLSNTVLVGFIDTKSYTSLRYEGGVPRPYKRVKGTKTKAIAQRMADGGKISLSQKQRGLFYHSGFKSIARRGYVVRKPHRFMNFMAYHIIVNETAKKEFENAVNQFERRA